MIVVRMPPSPTGPLHLGTARAALFNYLYAKKNNGKIVFRWEDTDKERSKKEFEVAILEGLKWLGMDFEKESEKIYRQSENADFHAEWLKKLWEKNKIFPCFLTPAELDALRKDAAQKKINFVFWSPTREEDKAILQKRMDSGEKYVWRLKVPKDRNIIFQDLIRGKVEVNTNTLGDFVIARSDGSVLYPLAIVLDDMQQGITHVLRGEDGISNTPKQILLFEAIGTKVPEYGHIPLVLDQKKRKLSKRNVDPSVCVLIPDFRAEGFVPEGVVNGLAFLGWNPKTTEEIFSLEELEKIFDLKNVNPGAAQYDFEKMKWFNVQWMRKMPLEKLIAYYNKFTGSEFTADVHGKVFEEAREKAKTLEEITPELEYLIKDPGCNPQKLLNEKMKIDTSLIKIVMADIYKMLEGIDVSDFNRERIREESVKRIETLGLKNGQYLWPFRVALSNNEKSSPPFVIAEIVGKEEAMRRIKRTVNN